ncbi:MAG: TonB-dependent receptor plug domain-containing protein, partial [Prevotella sp.]|nr:TonB-dependent receptor plug domain-containing protein [Prevotella sp.]
MARIGCECRENNGIVVIKLQRGSANKHVVSGVVVDENKEPVIGAQVKVLGTKLMTVTDADGAFFFDQTMPEKARLQITYIGMQTVNMPVRSNMLVKMKSDTQMLEGVVVTGYQQLDRRNLTSSVTSKTMEELEIPGVADLSKMLEGKIPDLISINNSGEVNATSKIRIRGTSTIVGNREPLWVLDGVILTDPVDLSPDVLNDPDYVNRIGNAIAGINPQDIKRIDVLKDAAATALYGTRAANGVIVVTTKSGREGKPIISYSGQFTARRRPYYSDKKINLMNSAERIQFSQYLVDHQYKYSTDMAHVGYEWALTQ